MCQFAHRPPTRARICQRPCGSVEDYDNNERMSADSMNVDDGAGRRRVFAWTVGEWGPCSRTCGKGGIRRRPVTCVGESDDGLSLVPIGDDRMCDAAKKPPGQQDCQDVVECPLWIEGQWSRVSWSIYFTAGS
jgi:hypothetical protein